MKLDRFLKGVDSEQVLMHAGRKFRSGRYSHGSGKRPHQREGWHFGHYVEQQKALGKSDEQIRKSLGMSTTEYRAQKTIAKAERQRDLAEGVRSRSTRGESITEMARALNTSESNIRKYLNMDENKINALTQVNALSDRIAERVKEVKYLDVSSGVEAQLGVASTKLNATVKKMVESGEYEVHQIKVPQASNYELKTTVSVMVPKGTTYKEIWDNYDKIRSMDFTTDNGDTTRLQNIKTPQSLDWDRVKIRYAIPAGEKGHGTSEDGQTMDGAMFIRRGLEDLNLGTANYAQVRIAVGGTHYLKGMALYGDDKDFPKGVDIIFNTNKKKDISREDVLKKLEDDLDGYNPFKATIKKQPPLLDKDGNPVIDVEATKAKAKKLGKSVDEIMPEYKIGKVNIVNEEGDWGDWSKALSSQFLSKQPVSVIKERLGATIKELDDEYNEILKVGNPTIKRLLMDEYARNLESKQVHIKASAPKGFQGHVILPVPDLKPSEIYAPRYKDGEKVILIRYPHAGRFEIPELTVNNGKNSPGAKIVGSKSPDAVGIHPSVASILSGADFDGDTVYIIPNNSGKFKTAKPFKELQTFDTRQYKDKPGTFDLMKKSSVQTEMGKASNLVNDMTLKKASDEEIVRAVKHSMVVIDAHKHKLNYKRSEKDNGIAALRRKYMGHTDPLDYTKMERINPITRMRETVQDPRKLNVNREKISLSGSTLLSRRKAEVRVGGYEVEIPLKSDPTKTRKVIRSERKAFVITMMKDAREYLGPDSTPEEHAYADFINNLKSRKIAVDANIKEINHNPVNKKNAVIYKDEVDSLKSKLNTVKLNRPKERQAQLLAKKLYDTEVENLGGKEMVDKDQLKRIRSQSLATARIQTGAKRNPIEITDSEWDAINSDAISGEMIRQLVRNIDTDQLRTMATPRKNTVMSPTKQAKVKSLAASGHTIAEIAEFMGVSMSTIQRVIAE